MYHTAPGNLAPMYHSTHRTLKPPKVSRRDIAIQIFCDGPGLGCIDMIASKPASALYNMSTSGVSHWTWWSTPGSQSWKSINTMLEARCYRRRINTMRARFTINTMRADRKLTRQLLKPRYNTEYSILNTNTIHNTKYNTQYSIKIQYDTQYNIQYSIIVAKSVFASGSLFFEAEFS